MEKGKLYEADLLMHSFGLLLSSMLERFLTYLLDSKLDLYSKHTFIYHALSGIILIVLFVFTNIVLKKIVKSKLVSRTVYGKKYVGGRWIEIVYDTAGAIVQYCILDISYDIERVCLNARDYDLNFNYLYSWHSDNGIMDTNSYRLTYTFTGIKDGSQWHDKGEINFIPNVGTPPTTSQGYFVNMDKSYKKEGFLLTEKKDVLASNNGVSGIKEIIAKVIAKPNSAAY